MSRSIRLPMLIGEIVDNADVIALMFDGKRFGHGTFITLASDGARIEWPSLPVDDLDVIADLLETLDSIHTGWVRKRIAEIREHGMEPAPRGDPPV